MSGKPNAIVPAKFAKPNFILTRALSTVLTSECNRQIDDRETVRSARIIEDGNEQNSLANSVRLFDTNRLMGDAPMTQPPEWQVYVPQDCKADFLHILETAGFTERSDLEVDFNDGSWKDQQRNKVTNAYTLDTAYKSRNDAFFGVCLPPGKEILQTLLGSLRADVPMATV